MDIAKATRMTHLGIGVSITTAAIDAFCGVREQSSPYRDNAGRMSTRYTTWIIPILELLVKKTISRLSHFGREDVAARPISKLQPPSWKRGFSVFKYLLGSPRPFVV